MKTTRTLEKCLSGLSPELRDIVFELRNLVAAVYPSAEEAIHRYGMTYYDASRGGPVSAGICQIGFFPDHIRLGFIHGVFLPDPRGLLEGDRKVKRYIRIYSYDGAHWDYLKEMIVLSARFDPYTQAFRK